MPIYRIFGRKQLDFYTKVEADNGYDAIDIANAQETHKWFPLPDDDTIEAIDVIQDEDDIQLNKDNDDEWPSMESGILIEGTN